MSYCEVDFTDASDEADPVEFVDTRSVKARKAHKCTSCQGEIAAGDRYWVSAYKFDGEFGCERMCGPCKEAASEFGFHLLGGDLWGMFADEWDNGAHIQSCINRLTTARAKEHMRQQWVRWHDQRVAYKQRLAAMRQAKSQPGGTAAES